MRGAVYLWCLSVCTKKRERGQKDKVFIEQRGGKGIEIRRHVHLQAHNF